MLAITLFLTLLALLLFSVPIGICLGLATMIVMVLVDGTPPLVLLARSVVTGADSFPLIAVLSSNRFYTQWVTNTAVGIICLLWDRDRNSLYFYCNYLSPVGGNRFAFNFCCGR